VYFGGKKGDRVAKPPKGGSCQARGPGRKAISSVERERAETTKNKGGRGKENISNGEGKEEIYLQRGPLSAK